MPFYWYEVTFIVCVWTCSDQGCFHVHNGCYGLSGSLPFLTMGKVWPLWIKFKLQVLLNFTVATFCFDNCNCFLDLEWGYEGGGGGLCMLSYQNTMNINTDQGPSNPSTDWTKMQQTEGICMQNYFLMITHPLLLALNTNHH